MVDDRELEALAAVDRQDLDRLGVGVEPPAALLVAAVARRRRRSAGAARPVSEVTPSCSLGRGGVQELADVAEVGQPALAVEPREDAPGQRLGRR